MHSFGTSLRGTITPHGLIHFNALGLKQNLADDIFKCIFMNENLWILSQILLRPNFRDWIYDKAALVMHESSNRRQAVPWAMVTHICVARPLCADTSQGTVDHIQASDLIQQLIHDDVIKWKHFPCYWPFVRGTHRSQLNSPHKSQWHGGLIFSLIRAWINGWVNNRKAGDFRRHRDHCSVTIMYLLRSI